MGRFQRGKRHGRFIGPLGRGFGVYWNKIGHRLRAYWTGTVVLAACWVTLVPGYLWIVEPWHSLVGSARWSVASLFDQVGLHDWRWTVSTDDGVESWPSTMIRFDEWHLAQIDSVLSSTWIGMAIATGVVVIFGGLARIFLKREGEDASGSRVIRGREMTTDRKLARKLTREDVASEICIGRVPLIKNKEAYNTLLLGAQGTGKTSATETFLKGIETRGDPAVIYDFGPGLLPRFFNAARGDIILNPMDKRTVTWSPWSEIKTAADCAAIADGFIPSDERDPFWGHAGRMLFADILGRLRGDDDRSVAKLLHVLLRTSRDEIQELLEGTNASKLYQEGGERTGANVEITTSVYVKALGLLSAEAGGGQDFSIQRFIEALDEPAPPLGRPWLWLTADPKNSTVLRPLLSCWTNAVATAVLSLPEGLDRRLWFVLDELATLHALPQLPNFMQNGRKRGGAAWITLQTPLQLRGIYKEAEAQVILNGCQTQAIFRVTDAEGAAWASRSIAEVEIEEARESTRLNSGGKRGHEVSLSIDTRVTPLVMPGEIAMLRDNFCYVKLPEDHPLALTEVTPRSPLSASDLTPPFLPFDHDGHIAAAFLEKPPVTAGQQPAPTPSPVQKAPNAAANGTPAVKQSKKNAVRRRKKSRPEAKQDPSDSEQLNLIDLVGKQQAPRTGSTDRRDSSPLSWEN